MDSSTADPRVEALAAEIATPRQVVMATRQWKRWRWLGAFLLTAMVLGLCGGIAHASIPDAGGTFHACYIPNLSYLRVIDTDAGQQCARAEAQLTWDQKGPTGVAAYAAANSTAVGLPGKNNGPSSPVPVVGIASVTAGRYAVTASDTVDMGLGWVRCAVDGGTPGVYSQVGEEGFQGPFAWTAHVVDTVSLASPGAITLSCQLSGAQDFSSIPQFETDGASSQSASITAIPVGSLNGH